MFRSLTTLLFFSQILIPAILPASTKPVQSISSINSYPLCLPGIYLTDPQYCLPLGPSSYLTQMAASGISFPLPVISDHPVDPSLGNMPFNYALLGEGATAVYASLQDAISEMNAIGTIADGKLRYVSYVDFTDTENGRIFRLRDETFVRVSSRVSVPHSFLGGIELNHTPMNSFGWILPFNPEIETQRAPGYEPGLGTGHIVHQYQIVQVYSTRMVNDMDWDLIAPDEWIESRFIGRVTPKPTPPPGVTNGRWIEVNLYEQTLSVYDQGQLVYATLVATGLDPFFTKPGLFQIQDKLNSTLMSGAFTADRSDFYYLEDVPWTMYYDHARALHGAYWRTAFGFPQSHGCVNLAPADAHWLFNWAQVNDWVYVWDPSGKTPTDPQYYGEGGA